MVVALQPFFAIHSIFIEKSKQHIIDVTGQVNDIWGTKTLASNFYDPTILRLCFFLIWLYETDWAAGLVCRTLHL
jgi:hypothetical protein